MDVQVDPYLDWLQIPVSRRPPTHYDLLGLPPFQADPARLQAAATKRIGHVRKYQVGIHGELAIRLMGEISQALTCLSDPAARQRYDAELRGLTTLADVPSPGMETLVEEPTAATATIPSSEKSEANYGLAPLSPELAGKSSKAALDKLSLIAEMSDTQIAATTSAEGGSEAGANRSFLAIVCTLVAAVLLLMAGGWMVFGSKKKADVAKATTSDDAKKKPFLENFDKPEAASEKPDAPPSSIVANSPASRDDVPSTPQPATPVAPTPAPIPTPISSPPPVTAPAGPDFAAAQKTWLEVMANPEAKAGKTLKLPARYNSFTVSGPIAYVQLAIELQPVQLPIAADNPAKSFFSKLGLNETVEFEALVIGGSLYTPRLTLLSMSQFGKPETKLTFAERESILTPLAVLGGVEETFFHFAFSPDGSRLATLSTTCKLWDASSGQRQSLLPGVFYTVAPLKWSPDSSYLMAMTIVDKLQAKVYAVSTQTEVATIECGGTAECSFSFSPQANQAAVVAPSNASLLATANSVAVEIWDLARTQKKQSIKHATSALGVAWSPDDRWLAIAAADGLYVARKGTSFAQPQLVDQEAAQFGVTQLEWLPSRPGWLGVVTGGTIGVWNVNNAKQGRWLTAPASQNGARGMSWRRDGGRLAVVTNNSLGFWSLGTAPKKTSASPSKRSPAATAMGAARAPGGVFPGAAEIATDPAESLQTDPSGVGFSAVAYSPVNDYVAAGNQSGQVTLWDESNGKQVAMMESTGSVSAVQWSPRGDRLASLHVDGRVRLWDMSKFGQPGALVLVPPDTPPVEAVAKDPDETPAPATEEKPAADEKMSDAFRKSIVEIERAMKDKFMDANKWANVNRLVTELEKQAKVQDEANAAEKFRNRLQNLAASRVDAAKKQIGKDVVRYRQFLQEAAAMDPNGEAGKTAQQMMRPNRLGPGF